MFGWLNRFEWYRNLTSKKKGTTESIDLLKRQLSDAIEDSETLEFRLQCDKEAKVKVESSHVRISTEELQDKIVICKNNKNGLYSLRIDGHLFWTGPETDTWEAEGESTWEASRSSAYRYKKKVEGGLFRLADINKWERLSSLEVA